MVLEPDAGDPPQTQFYGLGACAYGPYEVGTLWIYATDSGDQGSTKMHGLQTPELAYARAGTAWHRAEQGTSFIPNGDAGRVGLRAICSRRRSRCFWTMRFATTTPGRMCGTRMHWELEPQEAGLGMARLKPDRFVALRAGETRAELGTIAFKAPSVEVFVNARTAADGDDAGGTAGRGGRGRWRGLRQADCRPINGDSTAHRVEWRGAGQAAAPIGQPTRIRVPARRASVYSVFRDRARRDAGVSPVRGVAAGE